jgi:hypothetical protein
VKIIFWDIETAPLVVTSWTLWKPMLSHDNIIEDSSILCAAWKVLGERDIHAVAVRATSPRNDYQVVKQLREALAAGDVLVAHNGDKFDLKHLNARLVAHGLDPLPPLKTIDTLKVAKKYFRFTSNRLDYLGKYLKIGRKIHTDYSLWLRIVQAHDPAALAAMVKYNKQDVALLERVYLKLRPFMTNHPNRRLVAEGDDVCPICGAQGHLQKRGFRVNRMTRSQAFQCQKCGGWSTGAPVERTKIA